MDVYIVVRQKVDTTRHVLKLPHCPYEIFFVGWGDILITLEEE